ncbi:hypothetical protein B0T21DRAFT_348412 [Apiosordaria backusii]|uniref:Uncharacterized protein n=1 Tax=Apiosordaria backusii TaxID=314023 RepID=A0AA40BLA5_9PEZI|nr:hypothetical protein B0T21DRAFT_348412 [Apiosordaria backusii]
MEGLAVIVSMKLSTWYVDVSIEQSQSSSNRGTRKKRHGDTNEVQKFDKKRPRRGSNSAIQSRRVRSVDDSDASRVKPAVQALSTDDDGVNLQETPQTTNASQHSDLPSNASVASGSLQDTTAALTGAAEYHLESANPPNGSRQTSTQHTGDTAAERELFSGCDSQALRGFVGCNASSRGDDPGDPIHISSPPLQTEGVIMGLTLPELSGNIGEQLTTLIKFGGSHWPREDLLQFQPGQMITGRILYELLRLELNQSREYTLGVPPQRAAKVTAGGSIASIVMPFNVDDNHWVIAIADKKRKTFTAYGMAEDMLNEYKVAY